MTIINRVKNLNNGIRKICQIIIYLKFSICPVYIILFCKSSFYHFTNKKFIGNSSWSVSNSLRNFTLKPFCKTIITFTGNNSQYINIMDIISKHIGIHTLSILVNAKSKTTPNFLTLSNFTAALLQSTNLKYIWIVPTFTQSRMRKNKSYRRFIWISV